MQLVTGMIEVWNKVDLLLPPDVSNDGAARRDSEARAPVAPATGDDEPKDSLDMEHGEEESSNCEGKASEPSDVLIEELHRRFTSLVSDSPVQPAMLLASAASRLGLRELKDELDDKISVVASRTEGQHPGTSSSGHRKYFKDLISNA